MIDKKLKIDLSPLWNEQTEKFTVRFQDINEKEQKRLAQRIKDVAKQTKVRKIAGPTVQIIHETLMEINPIIFSEYNQNNHYRTVQGYRVFNINNSRALNGFWFNQLCQSVYLINCVKRDLLKTEIQNVAYLTCQDWDKVIHYIDQNYRIRDPEETERRNIIEEIGMEDIQIARRRAEDNGANRIPTGVFEEPHNEIDEIFDELVDHRPANTRHGILNEIINDGANQVMRTMTEEMYRQRQTRRDPSIERLRREINQIENSENPYAGGSSAWIQREETKIQKLHDLRAALDSLQRRLEGNLTDEEIENYTPRFERVYNPNNQEEQRLRPVMENVDPGYYHPDGRINGLRNDFITVDEANSN